MLKLVTFDMPTLDRIALSQDSLRELVGRLNVEDQNKILEKYNEIILFLRKELKAQPGQTVAPDHHQMEKLSELTHELHTLFPDALIVAAGGNGFNKLHHMIELLEPEAHLVGYVGSDENGTILIKCAEKSGFKTDHIAIKSSSSKASSIFLLSADESLDKSPDKVCVRDTRFKFEQNFYNSIFVDPAIIDLIKSAHFIDFSHRAINISDEMMENLLRIIGEQTIVSYTPPAQQSDLSQSTIKFLQRVDLLTLNFEEAQNLFGGEWLGFDKCPPDYIARIRQQYITKPNQLIVVTDGANGVFIVGQDHARKYDIPRLNGRIENTVGAGDSFAGIFMALYIKQLEDKKPIDDAFLEGAVEKAARVAAAVVQQPAAQLEKDLIRAAINNNIPTRGIVSNAPENQNAQQSLSL
ncbi:MAG: carbohydrate kinase family protein [Pseudomonadota bacterium]